jgi:hypothetical protein
MLDVLRPVASDTADTPTELPTPNDLPKNEYLEMSYFEWRFGVFVDEAAVSNMRPPNG